MIWSHQSKMLCLKSDFSESKNELKFQNKMPFRVENCSLPLVQFCFSPLFSHWLGHLERVHFGVHHTPKIRMWQWKGTESLPPLSPWQFCIRSKQKQASPTVPGLFLLWGCCAGAELRVVALQLSCSSLSTCGKCFMVFYFKLMLYDFGIRDESY